MAEMRNNEYRLTCRFNAFDTTVDVIFKDTIDTINDCQRKNYEDFISIQDSLVAEILEQVFKYYKESYSDYYEGWSYGNQLTKEQIEENLPMPTNPINLKKFIEPLSVYISDKKSCQEGTLGICFHCTWDINNGLGVAIKKWKVVEAGTGETAFLF